jgi:hypothetical protein
MVGTDVWSLAPARKRIPSSEKVLMFVIGVCHSHFLGMRSRALLRNLHYIFMRFRKHGSADKGWRFPRNFLSAALDAGVREVQGLP